MSWEQEGGQLCFTVSLLISTCLSLVPWIHVVLVPGAAQKNQLSRDQLHRPGWFQGALSRAGSPTSPCQLLWGAAFKAPWQNSQVSGQGGTLSDKLSFWRGMRLNPDSAVCLKEAQASHLAANYSIALGFKLLVFFFYFFCLFFSTLLVL